MSPWSHSRCLRSSTRAMSSSELRTPDSVGLISITTEGPQPAAAIPRSTLGMKVSLAAKKLLVFGMAFTTRMSADKRTSGMGWVDQLGSGVTQFNEGDWVVIPDHTTSGSVTSEGDIHGLIGYGEVYGSGAEGVTGLQCELFVASRIFLLFNANTDTKLNTSASPTPMPILFQFRLPLNQPMRPSFRAIFT